MYLIIGIDPGTKTGIAALDFDGNLVDLFSSKDLGLEGVIGHLIPLGKISMIATDVNPPHGFILKLAAQLGSVVFTPEEPLAVNEKIFITRKYNVEDSHQRDALAAALTAFKKFRNKFQKIDSLKPEIAKEDIKNLVLRGLSIVKAKKKLEEEKEVDIKKMEIIEKPIERGLVFEEKRIKKLEKQSLTLRREINKRDVEIKRLKNIIFEIKKRYDVELKKEVEIRKRDHSIENLEYRLDDLKKKVERIEDLKKLWKRVIDEEIVPVGIFPEQRKGLVWIRRRLKKNDLDKMDMIEIAFTDDPTNSKFLMDRKIMIGNTKYLNEFEGCGYVYARDIANIKDKYKIKAPKDISLEEIIEGYRKGRT